MEKSQSLRTSYSALETFKQCPQKFKFQEIDKIKVSKSKEAVFGTIIHGTLKFFHSQYPVSPTLEELLNYYKDNWKSEPFQNEQEDMIYFSEGVRMLKNYYEQYLKNRDKSIVLDTETRFEFPIEKPDGNQKCILAGKIDRIDKLSDETIEIIDYKTTKKLPSQVSVDYNLQFSIYCLGILSRWPHLAEKGSGNIKLTFYYLRHGEVLATKRDEKQLEKAKEEIWGIIDEIGKNNFKPIPSALCDWCGYQKICPMWRNKFEKHETYNAQQINKIIKEFLELKGDNQKNNKRLGELKEIVNNYLDNEKLERIFGEDGYITRLIQIRRDYDMDKIKKAFGPLDKWSIKKEYKILKASKNRK